MLLEAEIPKTISVYIILWIYIYILHEFQYKFTKIS